MVLQRRLASNHGRWFSVELWSLTFYVSVAMEKVIFYCRTCRRARGLFIDPP